MGRCLPGVLLASLLATAMPCGPGLAATPAGEVESLTGVVRAVVDGGEMRDLVAGAAVFPGEEIRTGAQASVALKFRDGSRFELGENASMTVAAFRFDRREEDIISTRVVRGVFRFVSGVIAERKPEAMVVELPVVTIGIRGTSVAGEVGENTATVILLEPEADDASTAIVVSNAFGSVTIDRPGFGTEVVDQFSAPSPPRPMRLNSIQNLIRSLRTIQRIRVPRPPSYRR